MSAHTAAPIGVTFGTKSTNSTWIDRRTLTWSDLAKLLTTHTVGQKDGTCIVPALLRGSSRKKEDADTISIAMLDSDTGVALAELADAVRRWGWAGAIHSTHSHMTTTTRVRYSNWRKYQKDHPEADAASFLTDDKQYLPHIAAGASVGSVVTEKDGEFVYFSHQPCPKFRVVVPLLHPWRATDYPSQNAANEAWKERIEALAHALGLQHDQSCTDTSRLFYLPRRPANSAPPESVIIAGSPCDLFALPPTKTNGNGANGKAPHSIFGTQAPSVEFVNPDTGEVTDLKLWAAEYGQRFLIADALRTRQPSVLTGLIADNVKAHIHCPNEAQHTNAGTDAATFVVNAGQSDTGSFVIHCRHNHCTGMDRLHMVKLMLEQDWLSIADLTDSAFLQDSTNGEDKGGQSKTENKEAKTNKPTSRPVNILSLVTHINTTPAWNNALRFNMLTENYEICPPFPPQDGPKEATRPLRDPEDILLATMYFQANGFARAGKGVVWDAITAVAHQHSYHPIRDYLNRLQWDGTERVSKLFQHYFSAEMPDDPLERDRHVSYLEHISTSVLVGAVARVMQPGCKHDHVPVVVGRRQGLLKSTAIRALCHDPAWFSDNISPDLIDRDTKESLRGKWIIELAEIPHIRRETERVKVFFSSQVDRYRAAYGKASQDHPRQCAFIGTSNDLEFVDVTGNRRFWPFLTIGLIDVAAIEADRDQLWAEALALYRQGVRWWLTPNIEAIASEKQASFVEVDIWEELISEWLEANPGPFTMNDLFAIETGITPYREAAAVPKADQMRAGRCLTKLGLSKSQKTIGTRATWWERNP